MDIRTCEIIDGNLPRRQQKLVLAWAELHQEELMADWNLIMNPLGVHSPQLAASSSYRRKPVSRGPDWIPCQARNDGPGQKTIPRYGVVHWRKPVHDSTAPVRSRGHVPVVSQVVPNEDFTLAIVFDNGEHGMLDMKPYLDFGVFQRIREYEHFKCVRVAFDTIEWDSGVDLDPEFVYSKCQMATHA